MALQGRAHPIIGTLGIRDTEKLTSGLSGLNVYFFSFSFNHFYRGRLLSTLFIVQKEGELVLHNCSTLSSSKLGISV